MVDKSLTDLMRQDRDDLQDAKLQALEDKIGKHPWGHVMNDQTPAQKDAEIERRVQERMALLLENNTMLPDMIASSVERAMRRVLSDTELRRQFWEAGYKELSAHAGNNASQWIGKRILTTLVIAVTTAGIIWLVKSGAIK